ncbi:MAG: hypothetical protein SNG27_11070 [Rikenellaceae bacterium]
MNVNLNRLRPAERAKHDIYFSLHKLVPNSKSWAEYERKLRGDGVSVEFKRKGPTDTIEGVKFIKDNLSFSESKVDKQFSYSKINYALDRNAYEESQRVAEVQRQSQHYSFAQKHQDEFSGGLGIFDLPMSSDYDSNEEVFRHQMQKKKKQKNQDSNFKIKIMAKKQLENEIVPMELLIDVSKHFKAASENKMDYTKIDQEIFEEAKLCSISKHD